MLTASAVVKKKSLGRAKKDAFAVRRGFPRLKAAIALTGKKQRAIADAAHMREVRLSYIICGRGKPPTVEEQARLSQVLNRSLEFLFREGRHE